MDVQTPPKNLVDSPMLHWTLGGPGSENKDNGWSVGG